MNWFFATLITISGYKTMIQYLTWLWQICQERAGAAGLAEKFVEL